jgi:beta-lactamase class A
MPVDLDIWAEEMRRRWAPLREQVAFAARRGDEAVGFQDDRRFEVGSSFKAFVAAEFARQVAAGDLDPDARVEITPEICVDSSDMTDQLLDGATIPLQEAAEAMIAVSDNTATDIVLRAVGAERVRDLIRELGLTNTSIPDSTASLYQRWQTNPGAHVNASLVAMADLVRFYRATVADRALGVATDRFLVLMREEDLLQGARWPNDATCYRKSGMVEPPPLLAMGMAGALVATSGEVTAFAFALNVEFPEDAAYEDSPLEPTVRVFSEGLRHGMRALAGG